MTEPTRRLPDPIVTADGKLVGTSVLTPQTMKTRGAIAVPSTKVIPVIVVPGVMGSNLRAHTSRGDSQNAVLKPGEPAWRPPNGKLAGLREASAWQGRDPVIRQQILDGDTLEVDDSGLIEMPDDSNGTQAAQMRTRWWGEVHWGSYGPLLCKLQRNLNSTFEESFILGKRQPNDYWESIIEYDREKWDAADMPALTMSELEKFAQYQYPVYACGYNWIQSNGLSAERLKDRILTIIDFWTKRNFDCKQVILVTHSMGGLVSRACAKQIPDKIVGIVHGVMPVLGAPLAYRRIASGVETTSPSANALTSIPMRKFADIAGDNPMKTVPTMATAGGPLELLPTHLYPSPWMFASVRKKDGTLEDVCPLFYSNIYDMYRDFSVWYRVIDPDLADPAGKYKNEKGGVKAAILRAIDQAEKFHREKLGAYYHPNTYAYYGADEKQLSYRVMRWITEDQEILTKPTSQLVAIGEAISDASFVGGRTMIVRKGFPGAGKSFWFMPGEQDAPGDGTVPDLSGDAPRGKVKRVFRTKGYSHQGSYADKHMLNLTFHLIVRLSQEAK